MKEGYRELLDDITDSLGPLFLGDRFIDDIMYGDRIVIPANKKCTKVHLRRLSECIAYPHRLKVSDGLVRSQIKEVFKKFSKRFEYFRVWLLEKEVKRLERVSSRLLEEKENQELLYKTRIEGKDNE